jgi:hypothetical protein
MEASKGKKFWGTPLWMLLHSVGSYYEPENAAYFKQFLNCYAKLLPCEKCKNNFVYKLREHPVDPHLSNADDIFFYTYLLHDLVNESINKEDSKTSKESPHYETIKKFYVKGHDWEKPCWITIHVLAATLRPENAQSFKTLLHCLTKLLPDRQFNNKLYGSLKEYPCDAYLSSNHDVFFYTYLIHDVMNEKTNQMSENYDALKSFYFNALSQECKNCTV